MLLFLLKSFLLESKGSTDQFGRLPSYECTGATQPIHTLPDTIHAQQ
jgi:hypothetical protein